MSSLPVFRSFPIASFLLFLISLFLLSAFFLSRPGQILAVCEYVGDGSNCDASTPEINEMFCLGDGSLYCVGADSATGQSCPVCIAAVGGGTCSNDPRDDDKPINDDNFNWQFFVESACNDGIIQPCPGETCSTHSECQRTRAETAGVITNGACGSGTGCDGTLTPDSFYHGAKFCIAPTCNFDGAQNNDEVGKDCGGGGCPACAPLSCSVISAIPTGSTTADAISDDTGGNFSGYDRVDWFLNDGYIGTTAMNTTEGTSSNSFTNLVAGTQYNLDAHYVDTEGGRPAVSCTGRTFQFNPVTGSTMTCSLSASPKSISSGGSISWSINNNPAGASAVWRGINPDGSSVNAAVSGYTNPTSDWSATYVYNNSTSTVQTYTRYVEIKDSGGTVQCTTGTETVSVNPSSCSLTVSPTSLSLAIGGSGQTLTASRSVAWTSGDTSIATVSPSSGRTTTVSSVNQGTTTVTARESSGCIVTVPVVVTARSEPCPGGRNFCGDSQGNGVIGSSSCTSGIYARRGIEVYDEWCDAQYSLPSAQDGYYCYRCAAGSAPTPRPPSAPITAPFSGGTNYVTGNLMFGKILQDINSNFSIDGLDTLISKIESFVYGKVWVIRDSGIVSLDIIGRIPNLLRGNPVYHMWTKMCYMALLCPTQDERAIQQDFTYSTSGSSSSSSNFIKVVSSTTCVPGAGTVCPTSLADTNYTQTIITSPDPVQGFYSRLITNAVLTEGWGNTVTSTKNITFSYFGSSVTTGSCDQGCTVQSRDNPSYSADRHSGSHGSDYYRLNPDGTCFLHTVSVGKNSSKELDPNQSYTAYSHIAVTGESTSINVGYYSDCTRYTFGAVSSTTPWSVSFRTPPVVGSNSLASRNWYSLFNIVTPESCTEGAGGIFSISPITAQPYCTCKVANFNRTLYASYDCWFPLRSGETWSLAVPGDYVFRISATGTEQINYNVTAGGSSITSGSRAPQGGRLEIRFTVPDSAVGSSIDILLSQAVGGLDQVTFGAPELYPLGIYEAYIAFGRTGATGLREGRVVSPPDDYPYTIGAVPPEGNYCQGTQNLEQCYLSLSESPLSSHRLNRVDFLLGSEPKAGSWFQVKDADLHATGSLVSSIPSTCISPRCISDFDLPGDGGYPGVPAYTTGSTSFGEGRVSEKGWITNSAYSGRRYDYQYFKSKVPDDQLVNLRTALDSSADPTLTTPLAVSKGEFERIIGSGSGTKFFFLNGDLTIGNTSDSSNVAIGNKKVVLFVEGSLDIRQRMNLSRNEGFFGTFVSGSINIDPTVSHPSQPALEGMFLANGAIHTGTNNPVQGAGTPDGQLYIRGSLVGWQGIILERDLDPLLNSGANNTKPAEFIEYAPDLALLFPKELLREERVWREIAP